jgi:hypothetical protein
VRRLRTSALVAAALVLLAGVGAADARPRVHRLRVPPPPVPPVEQLPTSLVVDMGEWFLRPSQIYVRAGEVAIGTWNRGMDDHDLTLRDGSGQLQTLPLTANGGRGRLVVTLTPGRYKLYCSLFPGTAYAHEDLGMVAWLQAR